VISGVALGVAIVALVLGLADLVICIYLLGRGAISVSGERQPYTEQRGTSLSISPSRHQASLEVAEIPPEIVAPKLKKPPIAKGGFGSRSDVASVQQKVNSKESDQATTQSNDNS
jgi:hypothetical protein